MILQEGSIVSYTFPETDRTTIGKIVFLGETIIHLKSFEGYLVKIKWKNFDYLKLVDTQDNLVA